MPASSSWSQSTWQQQSNQETMVRKEFKRSLWTGYVSGLLACPCYQQLSCHSRSLDFSLFAICGNGNLPKSILDMILCFNKKDTLSIAIFRLSPTWNSAEGLKRNWIPKSKDTYMQISFCHSICHTELLAKYCRKILSSDPSDNWVWVIDQGDDEDKLV